MAEVRLSPAALADMREIGRYTQRVWGREQRSAYLRRINAGFQQLAGAPGLGRARPELGEGVSSRPLERHVIYFRRIEGGVEILRVLHGRQSETGAFATPPEDSFG